MKYSNALIAAVCGILLVTTANGQSTTPSAQPLALKCGDEDGLKIDVANATVFDPIANASVPATITNNKVSWHVEYDTFRFDAHYGSQTLHNSADRTYDLQAATLNGSTTCVTSTAIGAN